MPRFLIEVSYTAESWNAQMHSHANVTDRITPPVEKLGGSIDSIYYAFGERDLIALVDFPSNEDAAAFSLAASAGGAVASMRTTPLLTVEEGIAAMRKADAISPSYHPPTRTPAHT